MAKLIEITGKALSGEWGVDDVDGTGIPVLRTTNFTNVGVINYDNVMTRIITKKGIEEKYLKQGDIIIEKSGGSDKQPVGRVVFFEGTDHQYLFNNFTGLLRIREKEKWEPKYVFYSLYANYKNGGTKVFENKTTGLHNLKTDDYVSRFEVKDRAIEEQKSICEKLGMICEIIKLREEQIINLDNLIKSRFVEMFGDEKRFISMNELCSIITDGTHQPPKFVQEGIPFILVSNIAGDKITYNTEKFISQETYDELKKRTPIEIGDVLLSTVGSYGHPAVVKSDKKFLFQRHIAYLKPKKDIIDSDYLHGAFLAPDIQRKIEEGVKGIAQKTLNLSEIKKMTIPVPDIGRQKQFAAFVTQTTKLKFAA